jgi:hypothetical protein
MQTAPKDLSRKIELRIRTMRTLWFALMMSIVMYFGLTVFIGKSANANPNNMVSLILVLAGMFTTIVSLPVKQKLLSRSVEQQNEVMVQQAYITAWALCEASALLGLLDFFLTGNRFYFVPLVIALIGDLINYPRRQDVEAASYKRPTF